MKTITLPQAGQSMEEGTIVRWCKAEGEKVTKGEILLEIETDKATVEVEATEAGTLRKILVEAGTTLPVHAPIALVGTPKESLKEAQAAAEAELKKILSGAPAAVAAAPAASASAPVAPAATGNAAAVTPVLMPQAGQSMEEGTIVKWRVAPGAAIKQGDIIFEVETDKAVVEVEATDSGRLARIIVPEGGVKEVKLPVALLADNDADADAWLATNGAIAAPVAIGETIHTEMARAEGAAAGEPPAGVIPVLMPQAGQSMEEGTIVKWRVAPGDKIKQGDIIFEVETDKAVVEVEATDSGRLAKIVVPEGGVKAVKLPVAYLADDDTALEKWLKATGGAAAPAEAPAVKPVSAATNGSAPKPAPAPQPVARTTQPGERVMASPAARKLANERGIDLASIGSGSGPHGRILSTDVAAAQPTARAAKPAAKGEKEIAPLAVPSGPIGEVTRTRMSNMRKAIGRNLSLSKQTIPHWYIRATLDADPMFAFYRAEKPRSGISLNDVVVAACARVVYEFPAFRSHIEGDELVELPTSNIGVAVGMEEGLVVPVVIGAERMSLAELASATKRVAESARAGKIEGMGQGVFTISNLGMYGVDEFDAIINPPEAAILAVGAVREQVIVKNGMMRPGRVMTVVLSCDHRVIDGRLAALFIGRLRDVLEHPELLA